MYDVYMPYIYIYIYMLVHYYVHIYVHVCVSMYVSKYERQHIQVCVCCYIRIMYTCICQYASAHIYMCMLSMYVHVRMHVFM